MSQTLYRHCNGKALIPFTIFFILQSLALTAYSETLSVGVLITTGEQRSLYTTAAQDFENANPGITVNLVAKNDSDYKAALKDWLATGAGPDVLNWQGGERLYQHVRAGKIDDLTEFWLDNGLDQKFSKGATSAVSVDGRHYAIPISYYQWGFFYRKSLFEKLRLQPPQTWEDFKYVCARLSQSGIVPITIGAKNDWPAAAWFDYLNLRINGLEFHKSLLVGEVPFDDERVRRVFEEWKYLVDNDYFVSKNKQWAWNEAMPFLYHKMAGMTLMGNFFAGQLPEFIKSDFAFFRFPIIDSELPVYEEAPLDLFMVPAYSNKKAIARRFLLTLARTGFQERFNENQGMISPNTESSPSSDYFIRTGAEVLNSADGHSQYFDRDTNAGMAGAATAIFSRFIDNPNVDRTLAALESARQTHFDL